MTKRLLFVDESRQVSPLMIVLNVNYDAHCDNAEDPEKAHEFLSGNVYDCVVIEPFDKRYLGKEKNGPYMGLLNRCIDNDSKLVIATSQDKWQFKKRFEIPETQYDGYFIKPFDENLASELMKITEKE